MMRMSPLWVFVGALVQTGTSFAQTDSIFRQANAAAGRGTALGLYGDLGKDCAVGTPPGVAVKTQPSHGALIVRQGKIKTKPTNRCPNVEVPIQAVIYQSGANYSGEDEVVFEVRTGSGKVQLHTVKIAVTRGGGRSKTNDEPTDL